MKPYAKTLPFDRIKGSGSGKKSRYCPCCISGKIHPQNRGNKKARRQQLKKEMDNYS